MFTDNVKIQYFGISKRVWIGNEKYIKLCKNEMIKQKRGFQYDFFFQNARAEVKSLYLFHKASIEVYLHTRLEDLEKVKDVVFDKISSVTPNRTHAHRTWKVIIIWALGSDLYR